MKRIFLSILIVSMLTSTAWSGPWISSPGGGGTGDVTKVGTPTNHQWGLWTGDGTLKGVSVTGSKVVCSDSNGQPTACSNLTDTAYGTGDITSVGNCSTGACTLTTATFGDGTDPVVWTLNAPGAGTDVVMTFGSAALSFGAAGITAGTFTGALTGNASTASNLSGTPALPNGTTATTQSQADASTKLATTAYG